MSIHSLPIRYDYYLAQSEEWERLLEKFSLSESSVVLELCTGWSPKMGLALARANFTGTFIAADLSQAALDECEELLMPVNHQFRINTWNGSVLEKTLPSADLIILNHALDDILLFSYVASQNVASASVSEESEYQSVERLRQSWQQGEAWMRAHLDEIAGKLAAQLTQARKPGGQVMIRQYEGYQEKLHQLTIAVELAQLLHDKLITALGKLA